MKLPLVPLASVFLAATIARGADDEWPRHAHDGALTGRTALKGDLAAPREAWSVALGGTELEVELSPAEGAQRTVIEDASPSSLAARSIEVAGPTPLDLDGSGKLRPAIETHHERWAKVLPDVTGLQRTHWDQIWTTAKNCHLELYAHDQGYDHPRLVWRTEAEDTVFSPLCVVADLDRDGVQEVAVALHYRVMIYEGTTGRKETELRFHQSRSYGWFGIGEVDGDPDPELIVLSDFQSHLDVLDYDPAKPEAERLRVKWRRDIEPKIEERERWPQVGPRPLADVDGDGRAEIVINLFNDAGDGEWHVAVLDGATGASRLDLPRRFTVGNADLDGDGRAEILCSSTDGGNVPPFGRIEVVALRDGKPEVLWSRDGAGFVQADLPRPGASWSTIATQGMRHALLTGETQRPAFLVLAREPGEENDERARVGRTALALDALRHDGKGFHSLWSVRGLPDDTDALALVSRGPSAAALVRVRLPAGARPALDGNGASASIVARRPLGTAPHAPVAARFRPDGPVLIVVQGAAGELFCLRPKIGSSTASEIAWRLPARGIGNDSLPGTAAFAELESAGRRAVLAAVKTPAGAASLAAIREDGSLLWRRDFPRTPGVTPVHNAGGLVSWWPGRLRALDRDDVFVNTRRGLMHSDVGHLLDGRAGDILWTRERAIAPEKFRWGFAGVPLAVADVLGDARSELVNLYPVCFWIADGATGELLAAEELASRKVLPAWAAYGEPLVVDVDGDGTKEVLLDSPYLLALLDRDGKPRWHGKPRADYVTGREEDNVGETTSTRHALLDLDGDGQWEIASAGYRDGVRAIDARDGKILWSLAAPVPTQPRCAAADVNGDGGDELLYVAGGSLVAVTGDRRAGRILWEWKAPATAGALSLPAIADVDGDGKAEIILESADGVLRVLDGPPREAR